MEFIANEEKRLDNFVCENIEDKNLTRSQIKKQIDLGNILVNGKKEKAGYSLKVGDKVNVEIVLPNTEIKGENIPLDIVFENDNLFVINKPQGMVVHPAVGNWEHTLMNALMGMNAPLSDVNGELRLGIVHRLDKNTSGLMLVAKNNFSHNSLAEQIKNKVCKRKYLALLRGVLMQDEGIIDKNLIRAKNNRLIYETCSSLQGKTAITHFKVLKRYKKNTLVEFELKTGRTHQIRAHAKSIGYPVVGDKEYGTEVKGLEGQLLHSYKISFFEPSTNEELNFEIPLPEYFLNYIKKL